MKAKSKALKGAKKEKIIPHLGITRTEYMKRFSNVQKKEGFEK